MEKPAGEPAQARTSTAGGLPDRGSHPAIVGVTVNGVKGDIPRDAICDIGGAPSHFQHGQRVTDEKIVSRRAQAFSRSSVQTPGAEELQESPIVIVDVEPGNQVRYVFQYIQTMDSSPVIVNPIPSVRLVQHDRLDQPLHVSVVVLPEVCESKGNVAVKSGSFRSLSLESQEAW
jgi:hypothetical protein